MKRNMKSQALATVVPQVSTENPVCPFKQELEPNSKTLDFGFDFLSVYAEEIGTASCAEGKKSIPNEYLPIVEDVPSAEDIVEALKNASTEMLCTIPDSEEDDDGLTAAEVLACGQKARREPRVSRSKAALQEQEDSLSVERILDQTLECAELVVSRGIAWGADRHTKIWKPLQTESQMANFLHGLGIKRYGGSVKWFVQRVSGDPAFRTPGFFETANHWGRVSFADGLLDVPTNTFFERTLSDRVTAELRWSYCDINFAPHYDRLEEAMKSLAVTEECYLRLQEICGVALHAEPSGRILYFQHYNPRVASIFTKLLGKSWSEDSVSFLGFRDHERSFRTAQVLERPVVISCMEGESPLRDISMVLALADGDGINSEHKNLDPFDFVSRCSLICSGRNLPSIQKSSKETMRYYLVRVNLTGELPEHVSIREILGYTREFIMWSIEGLRRFLANHGRFTFDEGSDIPREDASIVNFVKEMIIADLHGKIPSSVLYEAYSGFCDQRNLTVLQKPRLISYLKDTFGIESKTIRVPWYNCGTPVFGYVGIRFDEDYQHSLEEPCDDGGNSDTWARNLEESEEDDFDTIDEGTWTPEFEHSSELNFDE